MSTSDSDDEQRMSKSSMMSPISDEQRSEILKEEREDPERKQSVLPKRERERIKSGGSGSTRTKSKRQRERERKKKREQERERERQRQKERERRERERRRQEQERREEQIQSSVSERDDDKSRTERLREEREDPEARMSVLPKKERDRLQRTGTPQRQSKISDEQRSQILRDEREDPERRQSMLPEEQRGRQFTPISEDKVSDIKSNIVSDEGQIPAASLQAELTERAFTNPALARRLRGARVTAGDKTTLDRMKGFVAGLGTAKEERTMTSTLRPGPGPLSVEEQTFRRGGEDMGTRTFIRGTDKLTPEARREFGIEEPGQDDIRGPGDVLLETQRDTIGRPGPRRRLTDPDEPIKDDVDPRFGEERDPEFIREFEGVQQISPGPASEFVDERIAGIGSGAAETLREQPGNVLLAGGIGLGVGAAAPVLLATQAGTTALTGIALGSGALETGRQVSQFRRRTGAGFSATEAIDKGLGEAVALGGPAILGGFTGSRISSTIGGRTLANIRARNLERMRRTPDDLVDPTQTFDASGRTFGAGGGTVIDIDPRTGRLTQTTELKPRPRGTSIDPISGQPLPAGQRQLPLTSDFPEVPRTGRSVPQPDPTIQKTLFETGAIAPRVRDPLFIRKEQPEGILVSEEGVAIDGQQLLGPRTDVSPREVESMLARTPRDSMFDRAAADSVTPDTTTPDTTGRRFLRDRKGQILEPQQRQVPRETGEFDTDTLFQREVLGEKRTSPKSRGRGRRTADVEDTLTGRTTPKTRLDNMLRNTPVLTGVGDLRQLQRQDVLDTNLQRPDTIMDRDTLLRGELRQRQRQRQRLRTQQASLQRSRLRQRQATGIGEFSTLNNIARSTPSALVPSQGTGMRRVLGKDPKRRRARSMFRPRGDLEQKTIVNPIRDVGESLKKISDRLSKL